MKRKIWALAIVAGLCVLFGGIAVLSSWVGGVSTGLMGNAEQANIMKVQFVEGAPANDTLKVTIANQGPTIVAIQEAYVNGIKATNINSGQAFIIPKLTSLEITLTFPNGTLVHGTQQNVKLISSKGSTIMYSLTYDSANTSQYDPSQDDATIPIPFPKTTKLPWQNWSPSQLTAVAVSSIVAFFADLGVCKLAHYIVGPKNKTELYVLLFLVSVIVVSVTVAIVNIVFFPPQIYL